MSAYELAKGIKNIAVFLQDYGHLSDSEIVAKLYTQLLAARHERNHYHGLWQIAVAKLDAIENGDPLDDFPEVG